MEVPSEIPLDVNHAWRRHCESDQSNALSKTVFRKCMKEAFPSKKVGRRPINGKWQPIIFGVRLRFEEGPEITKTQQLLQAGFSIIKPEPNLEAILPTDHMMNGMPVYKEVNVKIIQIDIQFFFNIMQVS